MAVTATPIRVAEIVSGTLPYDYIHLSAYLCRREREEVGTHFEQEPEVSHVHGRSQHEDEEFHEVW